jgi:hypothetical protein
MKRRRKEEEEMDNEEEGKRGWEGKIPFISLLDIPPMAFVPPQSLSLCPRGSWVDMDSAVRAKGDLRLAKCQIWIFLSFVPLG